MSKSHYLEDIFTDLKDEIAFDEDVVALYKLLKVMLKYNVKASMNNWLYLMQNYNLEILRQEVDFTPLSENFIIELLKYQDLEKTFLALNKIPKHNLNIIIQEFINTFNEHSGIYQYFYRLIREHKNELEWIEINFVVKNAFEFNSLIFDLTSFLQQVIKMHIKLHNINLSLFKKITYIPKNKKEQALLKILFIDYI